MGVRLRDDVIASFRLVTGTDWWVAIDLLAGIAGYVVWVAGSAALGLQVASLADYPVAPGGTPSGLVLAIVGLLWLVLPAALGVARVRSRLLNIRSNIEQDYRLDRPAALLVPPALLVGILGIAAVAVGRIEPMLAVLAPATLYLLVRTTTYSYRVFAFSHPLVLYATLFLTLLVQAGILLLYLGLTTENEAILTTTVSAIGLPVDPLSAIGIAGFAIPVGLGAAVALPVALVLVYLTVQTLAALVVRVREPTVRPSRVRTGQRYPAWLEIAPSSAGSTATGRSSSPSTSSADSTSSSSDSTTASQSSADAGASQSTGATANNDSTPSSAGNAAAGSDETDAAATAADSVNNTRVFTPPDGSDDGPSSPGSSSPGTDCPACGATVPADADACPACGSEAT